MSNLGYFTRLIENTAPKSKKVPIINKDESDTNKELNNFPNDIQIPTHHDTVDNNSEIFTNASNYYDKVELNGSPKAPKESYKEIQTNAEEKTYVNREKTFTSETASISDISKALTNDKGYEMRKISNDVENTDNLRSTPVFEETAKDSLHPNLQENISKFETQFMSSPREQRLKKFDQEETLKDGSDLQNLLDDTTFSNTTKESIDEMSNTKIHQNASSTKRLTYTHANQSNDSFKNDHVSVSIDTIIVKVITDNKGSDLKTIQNNIKRNEVQDTDRLRRYYLRLR